MLTFEHHAPIEHFETQDDCLVLGGTKLTDIVASVGSTPLYIYDFSVIERKIAGLRDVLGEDVDLHYAIKANPMAQLVRRIADLVDGLDVASATELDIAIETDCDHRDISFAGPGKRPVELELAIRSGIVINAESETELERIGAICTRLGTTARVAIRVNPDFQLKASGMKMGGGSQQFGIDAERLPGLLGDWRDGKTPWSPETVQFHGFHIYTGSQNLRPDAIMEAQRKSCQLAVELAAHAPGPVTLLNIGGGFGIPYFPGEAPLEIDRLRGHFRNLAADMQDRLPGARLTVELGRYLVGECGVYVSEVIDKKVSRGKTFLIVDGGLHQHLAASGNFGQVLRKNYPVLIGNRTASDKTEAVSVVGPLCTPLDLLANNMTMAHADIGDLVVVFQSGAYGYTASPLGFLSHPSPHQVLV